MTATKLPVKSRVLCQIGAPIIGWIAKNKMAPSAVRAYCANKGFKLTEKIEIYEP